MYRPQRWRNVIKAVRDVAGFNTEGNRKSPSYALNIGHSLKKCSRILRNKANEVGDTIIKKRMTTFIELYEDDYMERVSGAALEALESAKHNTVKLLTLVKNVVVLSKYICNEINKAKTYHAPDYTKLCKSVLAQVILFNRKRSGEVFIVLVIPVSMAIDKPSLVAHIFMYILLCKVMDDTGHHYWVSFFQFKV